MKKDTNWRLEYVTNNVLDIYGHKAKEFLDDALKNVTGISKLWASTGRSNDGAAFFSSRGFSVQPQLVNGVAGITNSFINSSNIERIEVIKGPSGTLFGGSIASYGGLINIVTKKPYNGTGGNISASYGSFGFERLNADINITDKSEKFSLRFNTGFQNEGSFQDAGLKKSLFMAPAISYKVNNDLTFNLSYEVNSTEQTNVVSLFLNRYATSYYTDIESLNYNTNKSFTDNSVTIKSPTQNYRGEIAWKISLKMKPCFVMYFMISWWYLIFGFFFKDFSISFLNSG